ncbi:MAG: type II toxin-antitoxin system VapC family toxin [Saccharothrix sp.]|nr:type II toxin-antitoxin system VapC family toxin [Saccharothrix sp.]
MSERGLLDTSVVIDLPKIDVEALPDELAISSVTLAELAAGPHASADPVERAVRQQRLQWAESTFDPIPFDAEAARYYGSIFALVLASGRKPRRRLADLLIASVAAANDLPLLTRNADDFAGLEPFVAVVPV